MATLASIRDTSRRVLVGSVASMLIAFLAYRAGFNLSAATSVHLFLVSAIALRWGFVEASIVSLVSVACLDFFFTQPLFVFFVNNSHDWVALGTFETAALFISKLSNQVSRHARESEMHQAQLQKLYELSEHILLLDPKGPVEQQLAELVRSSLHIQCAVLWNAHDGRFGTSGECDISTNELRATYFKNENQDDPVAGVSRRVLRLGAGPLGSLLLCGHALDSATVNATASLAAIAIERTRLFSAEANAEAARQSEQLRSSILDGLAHAFKSPLTTIMVSSSGLLAMNTLSGTEQRLVSLIDQHAGHLSDLTNHLLSTAKLDTRDLQLEREMFDVAELIHNSLEVSSNELDGHSVDVQPAMRFTPVWADRKLVQMALLQLLDNAAKYGAPGSSIAIVVEEAQTELLISVKNEGSFIPPDEQGKVFQRFYRCSGSGSTVSGTGIGLSVVKRITEAHHGRTWVESDPHDGTTFIMTLPRAAEGV